MHAVATPWPRRGSHKRDVASRSARGGTSFICMAGNRRSRAVDNVILSMRGSRVREQTESLSQITGEQMGGVAIFNFMRSEGTKPSGHQQRRQHGIQPP